MVPEIGVEPTAFARHIPMNQEALEVLQGWQAQTTGRGLVFPAKDGRPLNNIKKSWTAVLETAGIKNFRFHDLRHHFASRLVMAGVDLNTVRELLGHADLTMTLRYAHLAPEHKAEAVSRLVQQ
jgi:integrase